MKHTASLPNAEKPARDGIAEPVPNLGCGILVRFAPVTASKGARWIATLRRDSKTAFRATVGFHHGATESAGRDAAAAAALAKFEAYCNRPNPFSSGPVAFRLTGCVSFNNGDGYLYTFANA